MSIAAMNWALSQELESCQQQALLYVIADSADPTGITRHCDPDYMARKARLSRATMFRRLSEMEELGLLSRRKYYTEEGAPRYEIRLNLEALIKIAIRSQRLRDDDSGETNSEPETETTEIPKSQPETLVGPESHSSEATKVSPVRQAQSHSCDYISPPLSKSLPPNPPPGGSLSRKEAEVSEKRTTLWERFVQGYPGIAAMDQAAAREELDELSIEDAEWAVSVLVPLKEELRKAGNRPPKNAHIWLRKGMFRNFPKGKSEAPPPDQVWIAAGSQADMALRFVLRLAKVPWPLVLTRADLGQGYFHRAEVGTDLLAMLAFVDEREFRWNGYQRGSPEFAAWQTRFSQWTGRGLPTEPGTDSIRAPCRWPPKKDGTIYRDDDPPASQETDHG